MKFASIHETFTHWVMRFYWLVMLGFALLLALLTTAYFSFRTDINFLLVKQNLVKDIVWMTAFYCHITSSILCLVTGPFQFVSYFRKKNYIKWHRNAGKVYIFSILLMAAPSGAYMAVFANGGIGAKLGFIVLSFLWFMSTYTALYAIRQKNIAQHRAWMVRSYALTFSAVTLRLWVPILSTVFGVEPEFTVVITAWINWIPNLLVGELLIKFFTKNL